MIGFLINPIAGMGGAVGLKGTDGLSEKAKELGAEPVADDRATEFIKALEVKGEILTASQPMGAHLLGGLPHKIVYKCSDVTTKADTIAAAKEFLDHGAKLIVFCGGDGTARDILNAVADRVPVLGIPAGVKMHSSVFAINPHSAAKVVADFESGITKLHEAEVMDVDEDAYRNGILKAKLYGMVKTPYVPELIQAGKQVYVTVDAEKAKQEIAQFAKEFMSDGSAYIIGAGSTTKAIAELQGVKKTVLGVDVICDGMLDVEDASEADLLDYLKSKTKAKIMVTPIGAQGFVFGRGTQQISAKVIRKVGAKNIIYVATPQKLKGLRRLLVDTGDLELDKELCGYKSVVIGYRMAQKRHVEAP